VIDQGAEYWKKIAQYGMRERLLSPKEMKLVEVACKIPLKIPTEKQSQLVIKIEKKLIREGFL